MVDEPSKVRSSQEAIDDFWKSSLKTTKPPTKPSSVLPRNVYAQNVRRNAPKGTVGGRGVLASYEEAVKECEAKVKLIVQECRRNNKKYTDPHFDLSSDDYCLRSLSFVPDKPAGGDDNEGRSVAPTWEPDSPPCAKRIGDIFENPRFFVDDVDVKDVRQGAEGDCWFLSALGSLCVEDESGRLVKKICPEKARDEKVGVYGFVFNRDGEWISEVVDDKLYLRAPDYDDCTDAKRSVWDETHSWLNPADSRKEYKKTFQTNSNALYYASCAHPDETWVPLLEKGFAKAHGNYNAINGGFPGEGVEDLTGGITTIISSPDILDKDLLWTEGLLKVNKEFLFGVGTRSYAEQWSQGARQGIHDSHAYSVLKAVNYGKHRLLLVKNPWGKVEWNGPWSDGSKEWTVEALQELGHSFGDDGIFWIPYEDFLNRYEAIWRTRLFTPDWNVTQRYTTVTVPWSGEYNDKSYQFVLPKASRTVIVLSKLDERYFIGLTGQYTFELAFRLHQSDQSAYIVRGYSSGDRSAVAEVDLEAGQYDVLLQISGSRDLSQPKVEDVVKQNWLSRRSKLIQIGLSYDLAHAQGQVETGEDDTKTARTDQTGEMIDNKVKKTNGLDIQPVSNSSIEKAKVPSSQQSTKTVTTNYRGILGAVPSEDAATGNDVAENNDVAEDNDAAKDKDDVPDLNQVKNSDDADAKKDEVKPPATDSDSATLEKEKDDTVEDPWNANCVVSLRVFCQNTTATIKVIGPDSKTINETEDTKLDVDDPQKDAAEAGGD